MQVEVQAGGMAQVVLRNRGGARVTGRVVDFRTGQAVAGVRCAGWLRSGLRRSIDFLPGAAWTDEDGRFELALPAGDTAVTCWTEGFTDGIAPLALQEGQVGEVEVPIVRIRGDGDLDFGGIFPDPSLRIFRVARLAPGCGAARAGVVVGDTVVAVDGVSVEHLSLSGVNFLLFDRDREGPRRVVLGLARGRSIAVTLDCP